MSGRRPILWLTTSATLLLGALLWVVFVWEPVTSGTAGHTVLELATPPEGGDFTLTQDGQHFALASLRGQVVLLYFGYTGCPDICPTSLAAIAQALRQLDAEPEGAVRGLFVSVDPERDTPERLEAYAHFFHPAILGVSGTQEELVAVSAQYGVAWRRVESGSAMGYLIDHSSNIYLIDAAGRLRTIFPHGVSGGELADAVTELLNEGG